MKENRLVIRINKPAPEIFQFTTTPPNSTRWIPSIIQEQTNEWPICVGTIYKLLTKNGDRSVVIVKDLKENQCIEWVSQDDNYHCRYTLRMIDNKTSDLEYYEWVDKGNLEEPFTIDILEKLKSIIEAL